MKHRWFTLLLLLTLLPAVAPAATPSAASAPQNSPSAATQSLAPLPWEPVLPGTPTRIWHSPWYALNRTLYVATPRTLYVTTDDGDTWASLYHDSAQPDTTTLSSMAFDPLMAWAPTLFVALNDSASSGYVQRSTDGGITWQRVFTSTSAAIHDLAAVRDATGQLVVFAVGELHAWRSPDGGDTWLPLHEALPEFAYLYRVFPSPNFAIDGTVYVTGYAPPIRSTDGGFTWEQFSIPWVDIPREVIFSPNYAVDGTLWVSYFWVEGSGDDELPMNGVVRSTDRGVTWQKAREGLPVEWPDGWILGLAASPEYVSDRALFLVERVATMAGTAYELYRSSNRGDMWVLQGLAPNVTPRNLIAVRRDLLFLATGDGLFRLHLPCAELLPNGNCELNAAWDFPATPITAGYSLEQTHSPARSIRVGLTTAANKMGYSSARQRITLPATVTTATLSFWLYPVSTGTQTAQLTPETTTLPAVMAGDAQYVLLLNDQGTILQQLLWTRSNSRQWESYSFDLSARIGQSFWLLFGVYNDGLGGKTGMYVDDVSITGCRPASAPPEPPPPQTNPVRQDFLLSDAAGPQRWPAIAYNPQDDEYLVVWEHAPAETESAFVIQRVSSAGRLLGEAELLAYDPALQRDPRLAYMPGAERYLAVWHEQPTPMTLADVHGRLIGRNGIPVGDAFPIAVYEGGQVRPHVASGADTFLVVWTDTQPTPSRIRGQRVSAEGALLGAPFDISDGAGWAVSPDVTYNAALGDFFVAWQDSRPGMHDDIYAQRVTPEGALAGANLAVSNALGNQQFVALTAHGSAGKVFFVWNDWRAGTPQLYGRELDFSGGIPPLPEVRISTHTIKPGISTVAFVPNSPADAYLAVWEAPTGEGDLLARLVLSDGGFVGSPTVVSDDPHLQALPALAVATETTPVSALAVWMDARVGVNTGIYGQRLDKNGARVGLHFGLTPLPRLQTQPAGAYSSTSDRSLIVWANVHGGGGNQSTHVMGYLFDGNGILARAPLTLTTQALTSTTTVSVDWDYWNDEFLAVWSDAGNIVGQRVTADGSLVNGKLVISTLAGTQSAPVVVAGFNAYLVIFEYTHPTTHTTDIFGQLLTVEGARLGDEFNISQLPGLAQQAWNAHATYDAVNNTFFVVWQEEDPESPGIPLWDIVGQMVAGEDGSLLGPRRILAAEYESNESFPNVVWAGPEDTPFYLLVWAAFDMNTGQSEIMARRLEQDGAPAGPAYPLTATSVEQEGTPAIAYDPFAQRFMVAWNMTVQGMPFASAIRGLRLGTDGRPEGKALSIAEDANSARQAPAVIARRNHAEWLIVWEDGRVDTALEHSNIYGRRIPMRWQLFLPLVWKQ